MEQEITHHDMDEIVLETAIKTTIMIIVIIRFQYYVYVIELI
jgi:hypothetical protein